jgi:hypothetical protein
MEDNIKLNFMEERCEGVDWIYLVGPCENSSDSFGSIKGG